MNKNAIVGMDIDVYSKTLTNGLEVYLVPMKNVKRYFMTYATKFGSLITEFTPHGSKKACKVPNGVAHFLEHKMFEVEDGENPFTFFNKSGTYSNASTGYDSTRYIASGTDNYYENLEYLMDFVNKPYFTDENVEKEKGIIIEELNMYKDRPDSVLDNMQRFNLFHKDPHRIDIGGEVEDVKRITKKDLQICYDNFYQPNNMFILIVGNIDVDKTMNIIERKMGNKENKYKELPRIKKYDELYSVRKKEEVKEFNVLVPKISYSFKIKRNVFDIDDKYILASYISCILKILFGSTSIFNEECKLNNLYSGFYYDYDIINDYLILIFEAETNDANKLLEKIYQTLVTRNDIINEEDFNRCKKVFIANNIKSSSYVDFIVDELYNDIINYNKIYYDKIDLARNSDYNTLLTVSKSIDLNSSSICALVPKGSKFKIINPK